VGKVVGESVLADRAAVVGIGVRGYSDPQPDALPGSQPRGGADAVVNHDEEGLYR